MIDNSSSQWPIAWLISVSSSNYSLALPTSSSFNPLMEGGGGTGSSPLNVLLWLGDYQICGSIPLRIIGWTENSVPVIRLNHIWVEVIHSPILIRELRIFTVFFFASDKNYGTFTFHRLVTVELDSVEKYNYQVFLCSFLNSLKYGIREVSADAKISILESIMQ